MWGWILIKKSSLTCDIGMGQNQWIPLRPQTACKWMFIHVPFAPHISKNTGYSSSLLIHSQFGEVLTGSFTETRQHSAAHPSAILPITTSEGTPKQQRRRFQPPRGACTAPSAAVPSFSTWAANAFLGGPGGREADWCSQLTLRYSQQNSAYLTGLHANTHTHTHYLLTSLSTYLFYI